MRLADIAAIQAAIAEAQSLGLTRREFARAMIDVLLVAMASDRIASGGVVSYTINGRSVTRSVASYRDELRIWQAYASQGGLIAQPMEFGA